MKINSKILSIPPYISTSWENVSSLQMDTQTGLLHIFLKNKLKTSIPNLSGAVLEEIFQAHSDFLEQQARSLPLLPPLPPNALSIGFATGPDGLANFSGIMQHDPNQKDSPSLPKEVLEKITQVAKALGLDNDAFALPLSEPHCNCPYCQISKTLHGKEINESCPDVDNSLSSADGIDEKELSFREWDIEEISEKLYRVSDPFNSEEHYQVFLGHPVGCTCGKNNCEHILAVLRS